MMRMTMRKMREPLAEPRRTRRKRRRRERRRRRQPRRRLPRSLLPPLLRVVPFSRDNV